MMTSGDDLGERHHRAADIELLDVKHPDLPPVFHIGQRVCRGACQWTPKDLL